MVCQKFDRSDPGFQPEQKRGFASKGVKPLVVVGKWEVNPVNGGESWGGWEGSGSGIGAVLSLFRRKNHLFLCRRFARKEKMITFALGFRDGELAQLVRAHDS